MDNHRIAGHAIQPPAPSSSEVRHLHQKALARRWSISTRSLERWRIHGSGPAFVKLNGRVVYRLEDIEAFEAARLHESTSKSVSGGAR